MTATASAGTGSLALVMIVRDGAPTLERCLASAAPHVDRMLVLDTGSVDDTVAIALAAGAQVAHLPWPGCFATARNRALELADADWNLVLDADEWLVSGGDALRALARSLAGPGVVRVDSHDGAGAVTHDWITRLLPRGVRYQGRVHEQPVSSAVRQRLPVVVGHDGYRPDALQAKRGRNRALLLAALTSGGSEDAHLRFQLGKDFETYGELPAAAEQYGMALQLGGAAAPYGPQLVVRAMHCLGKGGQLPEALALASEHLHGLGSSVDFQFTLGDLCLDAAVAHPADAVSQWLPLAEAAWTRCLDIGERPEQDGGVAGRGSYLAAHNLHVLCDGLGDHRRAEHYRALSARLRPQQAPAVPPPIATPVV